MTAAKQIRTAGRINDLPMFQFTSVLSRFQPSNPTPGIDSTASFGVATGQADTPRRGQFVLRGRI